MKINKYNNKDLRAETDHKVECIEINQIIKIVIDNNNKLMMIYNSNNKIVVYNIQSIWNLLT